MMSIVAVLAVVAGVLPAFRHRFHATVSPDDCRIYRLKKVLPRMN